MLQHAKEEDLLKYNCKLSMICMRVFTCSDLSFVGFSNTLSGRNVISFEDKRGAVASWLVRSSPDQAVRVGALAGDIVLCSWVRHLTLTVPLSTQEYN